MTTKNSFFPLRYRNWSDNQFQFFIFTFSWSKDRRYGAVIDSGNEDYRYCSLRLYLIWLVMIIELPPIVRPWRKKVKAIGWSEADIERIGRDWCWGEHPREYGFSIWDGFLQVFYGRQTHDSLTEQSWCTHLPWTQWRFIRQSWYGLNGELVKTEYERSKLGNKLDWDEREALEKSISVSFLFDDYDGKRITATTHIEEREWRFGEGWFKWLSIFRRPMIRRSLDIHYSEEVGKEKGSWKGGTVGTSIDMLPGELHEEAFRRHCQKEHRAKSGKYKITYVGKAE